MPAKSYVISSRKRLDDFLTRGEKLNRVVIRLGIITGKPRYPKGWVGTKSRERGPVKQPIAAEELQRRAAIRAIRKDMERVQQRHGAKVRRQMEKEIRADFRRAKISSKGLRRSNSQKGTAVAKVAGVLNAGTAYHVRALDRRRGALNRELEEIIRLLHKNQSAAGIIRGIGSKGRQEIRTGISREGFVDSRRLMRTTQFEIVDIAGEGFNKRLAKAQRRAGAARRRAQRKRKRAKRRRRS